MLLEMSSGFITLLTEPKLGDARVISGNGLDAGWCLVPFLSCLRAEIMSGYQDLTALKIPKRILGPDIQRLIQISDPSDSSRLSTTAKYTVDGSEH